MAKFNGRIYHLLVLVLIVGGIIVFSIHRMENKIVKIQSERKENLRTFCQKNSENSYNNSYNFLYSDKQGVVYCYVPKVACTNWKRMMLVFDKRIKHPLDAGGKVQVHWNYTYSRFNHLQKEERERRLHDYYSFMFVRHPFERILSAYRNKFVDVYIDEYQVNTGSKILKLFRKNATSLEIAQGRGVTFREFLEFIIYIYENRGAAHLDIHWSVMHLHCSPCLFDYNYIGKYETLVEDADQILKEIGVGKRVRFPVNARDKYKTDIKTLMQDFYSQIPKATMRRLYEIYRDDFVAFDYKVPDYIQF